MSENLNRSNQDFSMYDSMSIGELEEILRADAMGPERDDSDVDEILYVMEVLAKKRRQNGIAGKTALEAYQDFQQHYLPLVEEAKPKRKANVIPFRRIAAIAACLVLVFSFATSANAFCFRDVWNAVVNWAQETFCFSMGVEISDPVSTDNMSYSTLQQALDQFQIKPGIIPVDIPENFQLIDVVIDQTPKQITCVGIYQNESTEEIFKISVQSYINGHPEHIERSDSLVDEYTLSGVPFYIFENINQLHAVWIIDTYECYISGQLTIDEIKVMIDSIGKG